MKKLSKLQTLILCMTSFSYVSSLHAQSQINDLNQGTSAEVESSLPSATANADLNRPMSGFQVGARKGLNPKADMEASFGGFSWKGSDSDFSHTIGLTVGYAANQLQNLGFNTSLSYDAYDGENDDFASVQAAGNATVAINSNVIPFAGLNLSKYVSGGDLKELDMGIGYQLGVMGEIWKQVGYQFSYKSIQNSGDSEGVNLDLEIKSVELGLVINL